MKNYLTFLLIFLLKSQSLLASQIEQRVLKNTIIIPQLHYRPETSEGVGFNQLFIYDQVRKVIEERGEAKVSVFVEHAFYDPGKTNWEKTVEELYNAGFDEDDEDIRDSIIEAVRHKPISDPEKLDFLGEITHYSRFNVDGISFEEETLTKLRHLLPNIIETNEDYESLTAQQLELFCRHGGISLLAAQGILTNIQMTENLEVHKAPVEKYLFDKDKFKIAINDDREKSVVNKINKYREQHPDHTIILVYGAGHKFDKYFLKENISVLGTFLDIDVEEIRLAEIKRLKTQKEK